MGIDFTSLYRLSDVNYAVGYRLAMISDFVQKQSLPFIQPENFLPTGQLSWLAIQDNSFYWVKSIMCWIFLNLIHSFIYSTTIYWELTAAAAAKSLQSCPTLCDPRDGSPPGSSVPGILQARTLEWVAISFSNAWVKSESEVVQSCPTLRDPMDCSLPGSSIHGISQARVLEWGAIAFSIISY